MTEDDREKVLEEKGAWLRMCIAEHLRRIQELTEHKSSMKQELIECTYELRKIRGVNR